jgi:alanyl-tRNA synthetase
LVSQNTSDIFETDNFWPLVQKVEEISGKHYKDSVEVTRSMRILADHVRSAVFLAMDGLTPSNKDQGYALRRILRRMTRVGRVLGVDQDISVRLVGKVVETFSWLYPDLVQKQESIEQIFEEEEVKFRKTLIAGQRELQKIEEKVIADAKNGHLDEVAKAAFDLYQSLGYPTEIFIEELKDKGVGFDEVVLNEKISEVFKLHQSGSRAGAEQKFKGGLGDQSDQAIEYHTATHLLHQALRMVLGEHVSQKGSNITNERLRFDFSHGQKLTEDELKKVQELVNEKVMAGMPVNLVVLDKVEAEKSGALHFFGEKYGDKVNVYYIGESLESAFSKEFCGGPHVQNTKEIGQLEIYKQESIGKGLQRIYAKVK